MNLYQPLRVHHFHPSQAAHLYKARASVSECRNQRRQRIGSIVVCPFHHALQFASREQTTELCRLLLLSKVRMQTKSWVLPFDVSQYTALGFE